MAGELWANGTRNHEGMGDVLMIDVGGATTDIHSVLPGIADMRDEEIGLIINNEKQASYRTVEGNLGMRVSATGIVDAVGAESLEQLVKNLDPNNEIEFESLDKIEEYARVREDQTALIAADTMEDIDQLLPSQLFMWRSNDMRVTLFRNIIRKRVFYRIPCRSNLRKSQIGPWNWRNVCQPRKSSIKL